jgi:hypothetical protein
LYFYSIQVRSNTPKSFKTLLEKLKANSSNPNRILALEEIDEIGHFEDYDALPMYKPELDEILNLYMRRESGTTTSSQSTEMGIDHCIAPLVYDAKLVDGDKPFVKMVS